MTNTDTKALLREDVAILWNYVIEVQDLIAEIRALIDNPENPGITTMLRAGKTPEEILDEMIAKAKGDPIRANAQ